MSTGTRWQQARWLLRWQLGVFFLFAMMTQLIAQSLDLRWQALPDLPDPLGLAGPLVGVHNDAVIVAGGANFSLPVWGNPKQWHDKFYVLTHSATGPSWRTAGSLNHNLAYAACASTQYGVVCVGGNDATEIYSSALILTWNPHSSSIQSQLLPNLPQPIVYAGAAALGDTVYVVGGQTSDKLESASNRLWALDLNAWSSGKPTTWQARADCPGPMRSFPLAVAQRDEQELCLFVIGGRYQSGTQVKFMSDTWCYRPSTQRWLPKAAFPRPLSAGVGVAYGIHQVFVLGGDDGELFERTDELRDRHPGFKKQAWVFDTVADRWSTAGPTPQNQLTTTATVWDRRLIVVSGEIRPRVRTPACWSIEVPQ